jgi:hypothetical protein
MRSRAVFTRPGDVLLQGGYCPTKLLVPWGNWGPQYMFSPHDEDRLAFGPGGMEYLSGALVEFQGRQGATLKCG